VVCFAPLDGLGTDLPAGLSGAGYDDANNNYAYGDSAGVEEAVCCGVGHRRLKFECTAKVLLMQAGLCINHINELIKRK